VLYCFCMEKDLHSTGDLLDSKDSFTGEFLSLVGANLAGKSLGMITISPREWSGHSDDEEFAEFLESAYLKRKMSIPSQEVAQQILNKLPRKQ
jgi:hypothetical protein